MMLIRASAIVMLVQALACAADDVASLGLLVEEHDGGRRVLGLQATLGWGGLKDESSVSLIRISERKHQSDLTRLMRVSASAGGGITMVFRVAAGDFGSGNTAVVTIPKEALREPFNREDLVLTVGTDLPAIPSK
jgi:hypothetical protein